MKKTISILSFCLITISVYSQKSRNNGFLDIPKYYSPVDIDLIKKIKPNIKYKNWALIYSNGENNEIRYQKGVIKLSPKTNENFLNGFYPCLPAGCYYYFYTENGKKSEYISEEQVMNFLGKIDNIEEALFLALLNNYVIDRNYKNGNIYKEFTDKFIIYLSKITYSPYKKEAFVIEVKKNGEFNIKSDGIYHNEPNVRIDI